MMRPGRRGALAALALSVLIGAATAFPVDGPLRGWSLDLLTALRMAVFDASEVPTESPVVVVALDEETYRTPPFENSPTLTWTGEIGRVAAAAVDGGAKVVGIDVVFASSIEDSQIRFGEETVGAKMRGFDRDYLRGLAALGRTDRIILGEARVGEQDIVPSAGQRVAVGRSRNLRFLNVQTDSDGVVRRLPLAFASSGGPVPSFSLELAARAAGALSASGAESILAWGQSRASTVFPDAIALNFGIGAIPTYSLADLRACLEKGDTEFFRRNFAGKVVLFGSTVETADRLTTATRFSPVAVAANGERCGGAAPNILGNRGRTIEGVYVHATGVANLLRGEALREFNPPVTALAGAGAALVACVAALSLPPVTAVLSSLAAFAAWIAVTTLAFRYAIAAPAVEPFVAVVAALLTTAGFRFGFADRERRFLRKAFGLYLSPALIDRISASGALPALGGENREITILFSDVAGFTTMSERMRPEAVVAMMNEYLTAMSEIIESCGGYIDKYLGDGILAFFGAPLRSENHAADGVTAALKCRERLEVFNRDAQALQRPRIRQRVGLNSGEALVGNIGSRQRFNYTAVGDAVNIAARLEPLNRTYGTDILASAETRALAGERFLWREIDSTFLRGRARKVTICEPLDFAAAADEAQSRHAEAYAHGLASWRADDFKGAAAAFARFAGADPPADCFLRRCQARLEEPANSEDPAAQGPSPS